MARDRAVHIAVRLVATSSALSAFSFLAPGTAEAQPDGRALFTANCAACHGADLGGTGEAPALSGPKFLSDFDGLSLGDLFDRIRATMPQDNPGSLTRDQVADILAYLLKANALPAGTKELDRRSEYLKAIAFTAAR